MNKFYFLFAAVMAAGTISSAALIPSESVKVEGIDVRDKDGKYVLNLSKENILLEERTYKVSKLVNGKKQLVAQGEVVLTGSDPQNDTEAVWMSEKAELKIGTMVGEKKPKQVVVLKLKNINRTFAFELYQE